MQKRVKVILNPYSNRGGAGQGVDALRAALIAADLTADVTLTNKAGDAIEIARQARLDGYDVIVAAGGASMLLGGERAATDREGRSAALDRCAVNSGSCAHGACVLSRDRSRTRGGGADWDNGHRGFSLFCCGCLYGRLGGEFE
mgnify:CR=1 FL=1